MSQPDVTLPRLDSSQDIQSRSTGPLIFDLLCNVSDCLFPHKRAIATMVNHVDFKRPSSKFKRMMVVNLCNFNRIMAASSNLVTVDSPKHETKREVILTRFTSSPIFLSSPERSAAHEHMKPSAISLEKSFILMAQVAPSETSKATASCRCLDCENLRAPLKDGAMGLNPVWIDDCDD